MKRRKGRENGKYTRHGRLSEVRIRAKKASKAYHQTTRHEWSTARNK